MCNCGQETFIKKTDECKRCYMRRYMREYYQTHKPKRKPYVPKLNLGRFPKAPTYAETTYRGAHDRVRAYMGRPTEYTCVCGATAQEWAYNNNTDSPYARDGLVERDRRKKGQEGTRLVHLSWSLNIRDYDPLCRACHLVRDGRHQDA